MKMNRNINMKMNRNMNKKMSRKKVIGIDKLFCIYIFYITIIINKEHK
jgi:hypothetical protein